MKTMFCWIAGLIATLLLAALTARANEALDKKVTFDISAQPLLAALVKFSEQSGIQVAFPTEDAKGIQARAVAGEMTPKAALERLLQGSGLRYEIMNEGRIVTIRTSAPKTKPVAGTASSDASDVLWLAQAGAESVAGGAAEGMQSGKSRKPDDGVEEMLVEGEREKPAPFSTANLDLTRTEDDILPFTVFTAREIELSGAANLQDFLQNRLAQNFNANIPDELFVGGTDDFVVETSVLDSIKGPTNRTGASLKGASGVNLRGWGMSETVFLLNGRRMGAEYWGTENDSSNATPNLRGIPLASIERIEILPSAGSAIYGERATGGVVNIITRLEYVGGQLSMRYATPADFHAPKRNIDLSYGMPLIWGVGIRFAAGFSDSKPLPIGYRADVTDERWRRLALQRAPHFLYSLSSDNPTNSISYPILGATPNIVAMGEFGEVAIDGNLFGAIGGTGNFATVPDGYDGTGDLSVMRPSLWNSQLPNRDFSLGLISTNTTFSVGVDRKFRSQWRWSVDYRYSKNDSNGRGGDGGLFFQNGDRVGFNASNLPLVPGFTDDGTPLSINPFGQSVAVRLYDPRMQRPDLKSQSNNVTWGMNSTLQGAMGEWRGFADFSYSQNENKTNGEYLYEPTGGWYEALVTGAYNPFVDTRFVAPAAPEFYEDYIMQRHSSGSATRTSSAAVKVSGPLLEYPAGAVRLTAGLEWSRTDRYRSFGYIQYQDSLTGESRVPSSGQTDSSLESPTFLFSTDSYASYAESTIPLLSSQEEVPLVERLELFVSGRTGYQMRSINRSLSGNVRSFKFRENSHVYAFGLGYELVAGMAFRVSKSIGIRPPSGIEITPRDDFDQSLNTTVSFRDLRRGSPGVGELVRLPIASGIRRGGNPDLRPETSVSTNFGFTLTPAWISDFRLSVNYLESVRNDAISTLSPDQAVALEADLPPGRVLRGAPDGDPSGVGRVLFVDYRFINFAQVSSRSLDISLDREFQNIFGGRLMLAANASKNLSFRVQRSVLLPAVEQVRNFTANASNMIEWNANGQLGWERRRWSFGWSMRYFDYILASPAVYQLQGSDRAPWKLDHDINVSYRSLTQHHQSGVQRLLSGASITLGITNVLDREPRFWAASPNAPAPYDSVMGRSVWLQISKSFQ